MPTTTDTAHVVAEDAPLGVPLWPAHTPEQADNFTLARVAVIRAMHGSYVQWTYESGHVDTFQLGEQVDVELT